MKYVVTETDGEVVATYEHVDGEWRASDRDRSFLEDTSPAQATQAIEARLDEHRKQGRIVTEE